MDIENLIEQLSARGLSNGSSLGYHSGLFDEAATALSTLRVENEKLRADLEQAKAEHDAAISDLETIMAYGGGNLDTCQYCKNGQCYARGGTKLCLPQWRGQKEG
jgi:hypothetical protein|nr:MAG TPA: hypothetical protein [Caudoviricetes sp.]